MFLAIREIAAARGRFGLIGGTVALITLLLVMLSGLTEGLSKQNTSALEAVAQGHPYVSFSTDEPAYNESEIAAKDLSTDAIALGTAQTKLEGTGAVGVMGLPAGTTIPNTDKTIPEDGAVLSDTIEATGTVNIGGVDLCVEGTVAETQFSHSPVVWVSTQTWQKVSHAPEGVVGTVALHSEEVPGSVEMSDSFNGLPAYQSERGSLLTMQGFLYGISALVTVAFLTVWTLQRTRDLSILRALGATVRYLLRDALAQAALILAAGTILGAFVGWLLGLLASGTVPFDVTVRTIIVPAVGIWILGMAGALVSTRRVAKANPLDALGGNA